VIFAFSELKGVCNVLGGQGSLNFESFKRGLTQSFSVFQNPSYLKGWDSCRNSSTP